MKHVKILGQRIRDLRIENKLTQAKLAKQLYIAVSTLSCYETARRQMSAKELVIIAKFFGVSTDYLLGLKE